MSIAAPASEAAPPVEVRGETFVCISTRRWNSMWREAQQHMSRIARHNRVLFFEPGRDPDQGVRSELARNWPNLLRVRRWSPMPGVEVIPSPPDIPYMRRQLPTAVQRRWLPLAASINARMLARHVRRTLATLGIRSPILWLYEPRQIDLVGRVGEKLTCYYIYDEFADFQDNRKIADLLRAYDRRMVERADLVFACSPWIYERRKRFAEHVHLTPNAVDYEAFHRALDPGLPVPPELASLPRPIVGSAGMLDDRMDAALLLRLAGELRGGSLVLVGPDRMPDTEDSRALRAHPSAHLLGQRPVADLPAYVGQFDVALVPYLVAPHTWPLYPLKMFEYLACGRAVVSSALPEVRRFDGIIRVADSADQFVEMVRASVDDYATDRVERRLAVARENTWDERVATIYRALAPRLAARP